MIGTRLGPYAVTGRIGAGGMGEVYRATDTRLERDVAVKVLPAAVAGDAERLARFEREAKLLASLNHPNVAHVYGFESARLPDGASAHFLAMELVEGEDLAQRSKRGAAWGLHPTTELEAIQTPKSSSPWVFHTRRREPGRWTRRGGRLCSATRCARRSPRSA